MKPWTFRSAFMHLILPIALAGPISNLLLSAADWSTSSPVRLLPTPQTEALVTTTAQCYSHDNHERETCRDIETRCQRG
jgi:hypothetical protein